MVKASVPVFKDLRLAVNKDGKNNDLTDAVGKLPAVQAAAARASGPTVQAMIDAEPTFTFLRPYVPDLLNTVGKLGLISANYDANGHFVRVQPGRHRHLHRQRRLPRPDRDRRPVPGLRPLRG